MSKNVNIEFLWEYSLKNVSSYNFFCKLKIYKYKTENFFLKFRANDFAKIYPPR